MARKVCVDRIGSQAVRENVCVDRIGSQAVREKVCVDRIWSQAVRENVCVDRIGSQAVQQQQHNNHHRPREMRLRGILIFRGVVVGVAKANQFTMMQSLAAG